MDISSGNACFLNHTIFLRLHRRRIFWSIFSSLRATVATLNHFREGSLPEASAVGEAHRLAASALCSARAVLAMTSGRIGDLNASGMSADLMLQLGADRHKALVFGTVQNRMFSIQSDEFGRKLMPLYENRLLLVGPIWPVI